QPPKLMRKFNHFFDKATEKYTDGVRFMLKRTALGVSLFVAIIAVSLLLFSRLPSGLVPTEDQGFVQAAHYLPDGASFERNGEFTAEWNEKLRNHPLIDSVLSFNGYDVIAGGLKSNAGASFVVLKHWDDRDGEGESSL